MVEIYGSQSWFTRTTIKAWISLNLKYNNIKLWSYTDHVKLTMLYLNICYNEVCYKGAALYSKENLSLNILCYYDTSRNMRFLTI